MIATGFASFASAARAVRVAEVTTIATEPSAAFEEAMRTALVRITGTRDADQDPAFSALIGNARRYVQMSRAVSSPPGVLVMLDGAAIERAVVAAGKSVWPHERPVVLVVIAQPAAGGDAAATLRTLEETAALRGLPIIVTSGVERGADALMAGARAQGADAALVAVALSDSSWRWSLYTSTSTESFDGSLASGIHGAADALSSATQAVLTQPEAEALLRVDGLSTLRDYATVARALGALSGVRSASVIEAGPNSASFRVTLRGGSDGLVTLLGAEAHLRPVAADGGMLVYQYQP